MMLPFPLGACSFKMCSTGTMVKCTLEAQSTKRKGHGTVDLARGFYQGRRVQLPGFSLARPVAQEALSKRNFLPRVRRCTPVCGCIRQQLLSLFRNYACIVGISFLYSLYPNPPPSRPAPPRPAPPRPRASLSVLHPRAVLTSAACRVLDPVFLFSSGAWLLLSQMCCAQLLACV